LRVLGRSVAVVRRRRAELGLSQADLAKAAGVDTRQIRRYEAGQQQPVLSVAVAIANALGISVSELAGTPSHRVSLTGDWWTCWQTSRSGVEDIRTQPVHLDQHGELIQIEATARGRPVEEGGYLWRGELRLWDNEILMGWYAANDGSVRSKGTMYFVMHPTASTPPADGSDSATTATSSPAGAAWPEPRTRPGS
jgi:transcriptional regulator with XRE-family HTH domain